ncbi:MAG: ATP-binding protein [Verrucomicrobiota bacterium]
MKTITVSAKKDFLERLATVAPMKALSELIWNGLDAGSDLIEVELEQNTMSGLERIRVRDHGTGIPHDKVESYFGDLGNSWKSSAKRFKGRSLHGSKGEGRFKAFALGNRVEWNTVFKNGASQSFRYQIIGRADSREKPAFNEPVAANGDAPGTEVLISEIEKTLGTLLDDTAIDELAKQFAAYLSKYPKVEIQFNGVAVDPSIIQDRTKDIQLVNVVLGDGSKIAVDIHLIEWKTPTKRVLHLCDSSGVCLHEADAGVQIRAPGFHFTAFIKTDHFRKLNEDGLLVIEELSPDLDAILKASKKAIRGYFRKRLAEQHIPAVERWKEEDIYPYDEKEHLSPVEEAERQVFDIIAVKVESYLPDFDESDVKSKQFVFRLLAQALHQNPESLQQIITEVLKLKPKEQDDLADLLNKTSFQAIITAAKTVANRLDFLVGLENLVFDKDTKKKLLERDQLHKILENEAWIFDENFTLSGSEERLEEVLKLHLGELGNRNDDDGPVLLEGDKQGRVDLMLSRIIQPRHDERDHLVIELKRPSQPINSKILGQVEGYAIAVAKDPRFLKEKTRWRFVVVSNNMDEHAKRKAKQRDKPPGLVFDDADLNIQVWAYDWTDIIANAKARLQFINASLSYEANRESSKAYLLKAHARFIPQSSALEADEPEEGRDEPEVPHED